MNEYNDKSFPNPSPLDPEKSLTALLKSLAGDDFGVIDTATFMEDECTCKDCKTKRSILTVDSMVERKIIQSCWLELRQYIRIVYRLSMKGSLKSIDTDYQEYMKDVVARLFDVCDPHQLFQRLEAQVKEFIIEVKILLLQILDRMSENPRLPQIFITGLLDRYKKVISAANVIEPILTLMEKEHHKFQLTWKLLNKRLFHSIIYSDMFFQNSVPLFISQLGKGKGAEANKELVREFSNFDHEIGLIQGQWVEVETSVLHRLRRRATTKEKKKIKIREWEEFKAARKMGAKPPMDKSFVRVPISENTTHKMNIVGDPDLLVEPSCECHVCHDLPAHPPVELIDQMIPINSHHGGFHLYPHIHGPRGDLGPFMQECALPELCGQIVEQVGGPPLGGGEGEIQATPGPPCSHIGVWGPYRGHSHSCAHARVKTPLKLWQGAFTKGANKLHKMEHGPMPKHLHPSNIRKRVDKATQKDQDIMMHDDSLNIGHPKASPRVPQTKDHGPDAPPHHFHCAKHSEIKRIPFVDHDDEVVGHVHVPAHGPGHSHHVHIPGHIPLHVPGHGSVHPHTHGPDDAHSDNSPSDPRHCDCCYCEVFGHGIPSSAPMSRNYQEMRERLRLLLNKKKKCKNNPTISPSPLAQQTSHRKQQQSPGTQTPNPESDTRALEDLLDFIEGTEVKCRNEKKAAKKARQKEKKMILLDRKKREEEEKARLLEESIHQKKREEEEREREILDKARLSKSKKRGKNSNINSNHRYNNIGNRETPSSPKPGPQMVTIKRVMEPHNSEPTVTITLRGATPNQDRVLYTLLNGQVCKMKDLPNDRKFTTSTSNQPKTNISNANINAKAKEIPNEKPKNKKDSKKKEEPPSPAPPKPRKELTNPTSIQINNAINSLSKKPSPAFNIADIKLPPGITITKVDPSTVQPRSPKIQENSATKKVNNNPPRPPSEVIVVSTGKRKDTPVLKESVPENGKKKRNKKKNVVANGTIIASNGNGPSYPGLEIQPIKIMETEKEQSSVNQMSVLTISPYADSKSETNENKSKKKKKPKKPTGNNTINTEEWKLLDSVFAPKDIDLDDGEMDDAERELEAFKRFCLQSVPPKRKEKVHLNIKDIVLKKKAASFEY